MDKKKSSTKPHIATLGSLRKPESSSSDEEGQAFYVGGSTRSGQQVLGPSKNSENSDELISNMFKAVKEGGFEMTNEERQNEIKKQFQPFKDRGMRLADSLPDDEQSTSTSTDTFNFEPKKTFMNLKMWQNGFSIDDGPLQSYDDESSKEFLDSIARGEVPRELIRQARGAEVNLNMEDHRNEDYVAIKKKLEAFSGQGYRLGAVVPETISSSFESSMANKEHKNEENAKHKLATNQSKPVTNIQVRLADGSRLVIKANLTHTIQDLRNYICEAYPTYGPRPFVLMTSFPNKQLDDESLTIEEADLQNASIIQKLI